MKFTNEQIDYVKHCGEHFELLMGGRGHSKTKQIIEQLQQENQQLKERTQYLERSIARKEETIDDKQNEIVSLVTTLEEIRNHAKNHTFSLESITSYYDDLIYGEDILQIIDKAKESDVK